MRAAVPERPLTTPGRNEKALFAGLSAALSREFEPLTFGSVAGSPGPAAAGKREDHKDQPERGMTSAKRWAELSRWWVEMLMAERANIPLATTAPVMQPAIWAGM
jgi:hypothetical protein